MTHHESSLAALALALCLALTAPAALAAGTTGDAGEDPGPRRLREIPTPAGFLGHLAYDRAAERLYLVSLGPPANTAGPSTLYELDRDSGEVVRRAELPFLGTFGAPTILDGDLYQAIYLRSKLYRVSTEPGPRFGDVVAEVDLPRVSELAPERSHELRFPFVEIQGLAPAPSRRLLLQASDLGELITFDPGRGRVEGRLGTVTGLSGLTAVPASGGRHWLLANRDAESAAVHSKVRTFYRRGPDGLVPIKRSKAALHARRDEPKTVDWLLLDAATGDVLATAEDRSTRGYASSVALLDHQPGGGPFGRFTFLALGAGSILTLEWTPSAAASTTADRAADDEARDGGTPRTHDNAPGADTTTTHETTRDVLERPRR